MTEIVIRNQEFLDTLNSISDEFFSYEDYDDPKYLLHQGDIDNGEFYCSREHLMELFQRQDEHIGFPESHMGQPITHMVKEDPDKWAGYMQRVKFDFAAEIGAHTSALLNFYPAGGFVGWHTNWNANAYQILFTYSKTGSGYFSYYDKKLDEIVTIQDKKGWQARHYYFGALDEPDHHCWHSAYAGGERLTLAYKFVNNGLHSPQNEQAIKMRDLLIEEIELSA